MSKRCSTCHTASAKEGQRRCLGCELRYISAMSDVRRLLVCGDRKWSDYQKVLDTIERIMPEVVIHGAATGADEMAGRAADALGIPVEVFPADWQKYGRAAGPIRNKQMLNEGQPDLVLAFHDDIGHSRGTKHMVTIAGEANVDVVIAAQRTDAELHYFLLMSFALWRGSSDG